MTYHSVWRQFNSFLIQLDYIPPIWEERVELYCVHLVKNLKVQSSTLRSYVSAIKSKLEADGYKWSSKLLLLNSLTCSCREQNDTVLNRLPIQKPLLDLILFQVSRIHTKSNESEYLRILYQTVFLTQYYGLMRVGEVASGPHALLVTNVYVSDGQQVKLVLYSSKTHGKNTRPQKIRINAIHRNKKGVHFFCPVKAINEYISVRKGYRDSNEQFFIFNNYAPLTPNDVRKTLRKALANLNLDPDIYDTHSFRIGRATDMFFKEHVDIESIKKIGRWESNAVYKYLRE